MGQEEGAPEAGAVRHQPLAAVRSVFGLGQPICSLLFVRWLGALATQRRAVRSDTRVPPALGVLGDCPLALTGGQEAQISVHLLPGPAHAIHLDPKLHFTEARRQRRESSVLSPSFSAVRK